MFGNLVRSFKGGGMGAKAIQVLAKTYGLALSHPAHMDMIKRISLNYGEVYNEHEMAVHFLSEFSNTIKTDHPQAQSEIKKYIKLSKGALNRGLITEVPLEELCKVAKSRFGINPDEIKAV